MHYFIAGHRPASSTHAILFWNPRLWNPQLVSGWCVCPNESRLQRSQFCLLALPRPLVAGMNQAFGQHVPGQPEVAAGLLGRDNIKSITGGFGSPFRNTAAEATDGKGGLRGISTAPG